MSATREAARGSGNLRRTMLCLAIVGHVAAAACAWMGEWAWALCVLLPAAFVVVHGSLWPHSPLFGPVLRSLPAKERLVWLTFDDGPDDDTDALLDVLDRYRARATFFLVGERAAAQPQRVRALIERGHRIGNHSMTHPAGRFWMLTPAAFERELRSTQDTIAGITGIRPRWFRAVAGLTNPGLDPVIRRNGLRRVSWSGRGFDTVDGDDARVLRRLVRAIRPGAILMLHQGLSPGRLQRLATALLDELAARGYRTVVPEPEDCLDATTSQLLKGVRPQSGVKVAVSPCEDNSAARASRPG
jgi:peptidoglycan/xylan/chitin deacetylase (PgdA/CDA1 family)